MRRRDFLRLSLLSPLGAALTARAAGAARQAATRKILIAGGNYSTPFIRYMAQLTGKPRPKLLYLPTASADSPSGIISWYRSCAPLERRARWRRTASSRAPGRRRAGKKCCSRSTASSLRRQHAQPAGDLEGAGHRRHPAPGVGSRHRARRRERRLAVLVRGGHDRLAAEGADDGPVPRVPEGQPLAALRSRAGSAAALSEADRLRADEARLRVRQRRRHLLRGQRSQARRVDARRREGVLRQRGRRQGRRDA